MLFAGYYKEGFLSIQYAVDQAFVNYFKNASNYIDGIDVLLKRHPYPPYLDDKFVLVLQTQLPFFILLSFIFPALNIVKELVHEKERKLKVDFSLSKYYMISLISITVILYFKY